MKRAQERGEPLQNPEAFLDGHYYFSEEPFKQLIVHIAHDLPGEVPLAIVTEISTEVLLCAA